MPLDKRGEAVTGVVRCLRDVELFKMTYEHREETLPAIAQTLVRLVQRHPDETGLVHCHSYDIQERLAGDLCRWQVLCKAPYPNTRDSRVARRLEEGQWGRYYRAALRTVMSSTHTRATNGPVW